MGVSSGRIRASARAIPVVCPMFGPFRRSRGRSRPGPEPDVRRSVETALERAAEGGSAPALARLDADATERLLALAARFLATRRIEGAGGFEPDAALGARIAVEACLAVVNLPAGLDAYARAKRVIVYPSGFLVEQRWTDEDGVEHEREAELAGEAWDGGPVILAADDVEASAPGFSVVVHEFAHVLDAANGALNGFPDVVDPALRAAWPATFDAASKALAEAVERGEIAPLDEYALEDPSEFFAVATETFLTDPVPLRRRWPELYALLAGFYGQDPAGRGCRHAGRPPRSRRPA